MDEVGYDITLKRERRVSNIKRKECINRIRKLRKIGLSDLPPPYPNGWYSIMESTNLSCGEVNSITIFGEQIVVFRTMNAYVYALDAYCPHLGAHIGIGGKIVGDTILCPFHKWSFRGSDGLCDTIPYSTTVPQFSKLKKWLVREVNESIFVWYSAETNQQPWDIPQVKEIESNKLIYQGKNEFYVNCHIQEIPENGADLSHFSSIHAASFLAGGAEANTSIFKNVGRHDWHAIWKQAEFPTKHIAHITLAHSLKLIPHLDFLSIQISGEQLTWTIITFLIYMK